MKSTAIPQTDSVSELAKFWDTHDVTDFEDELEEVREPVFARKTEERVIIHLPPHEAAEVKRRAETEGIRPANLIRKWVLEKLNHAT